jgi:cobalamin biosynthetic protein CobC
MTGSVSHGGGITAAARTFGGRPEDWLDLSTGINPCPVTVPEIPVRVWHRLPDAWLFEQARLSASKYYQCPKTLPLPVPGTQSAIQLLPDLVQGKRIAILSPTYGEYARAFKGAGFQVDLIADVSDILPEHRAVVVVNPNNPTGHLFSRKELLALHDRLSGHGTLLIVDEAFGDMVPDCSVATEAGEREGLIVLRSFGKFFGLAGLRLGFVIAKPDMLDRIESGLGPWAVSGPALYLAADMLSRDTGPVRQGIRARADGLSGVLETAGLTIAGRTDLFTLVHHDRAGDLYDHLAKAHILVRRFDYQPCWLRFGLTPDQDADQRLAQALAHVR